MNDYTSEQKKAIETIDNNLSVAAGAGSGKTRVLVERFVNIMRKKKAAADEILAITFTRKAAREMRERIRSEVSSLVERDVEQSFFWQEQLRILERAQINTIDSFCSRVLKEHPVEAGMEPGFKIAEDFELADFYEAELKKYLNRGIKQNQQELMLLLNDYGVNTLKSMLLSLTEKLPRIIQFGDISLSYKKIAENNYKDLKDKTKNCFRELEEVYPTIKNGTKHKQQLDEVFANKKIIQQAIETIDKDILRKYLISLSAGVSADKELVKELRDCCRILIEDWPVDIKAVELSKAWLQVIKEFAEQLELSQKKENIYGFHDIAEKAYYLLKENKHILNKYRQRYCYIMVDEFQDTNDLQKKLVYLLAGGDDTELREKRLFIVGDAKQSIYRFRGAEVGVFTDVMKDIAKNGGVNVELADNFRSSPQILNLCNQVFEKLMEEKDITDIPFQKLEANCPEGEAPTFMVVETTKTEKSKALALEAKLVVNKIIAMTQLGCHYGDMTILLSVINKAQHFTNELKKAKIPFRLIDGKGYFEKQEVLDVINLLNFLANDRRSLELCGVLRSPYFALSDELITGLLLLKKDEQTLWEFMLQEEFCTFTLEEQSNIKRTTLVLKRLRSLADTVPLPELVEEIFKEVSMEALLVGQTFGEEKYLNVQKLKKMALDLAMNQGYTLRTFLSKLQKMRQVESRIEVNDEQGVNNAVTIMTIHKAKGLQFPIVFLPALNAKGRNDFSQILFDEQLGLGIKVVTEEGELGESSVFKKIKEQNNLLNIAEKKRQLYVAMTRAERELILSGVEIVDKKAIATNEWFGQLKELLPEATDMNELLKWETYDVNETFEMLMVDTEAQEIRISPAVYEQIKPLAAYTEQGDYIFSATSLARFAFCPRSFFYEYIYNLPPCEILNTSDLPAGENKPLAANKLGLIVHSTLENIEQEGLEKALQKALTFHYQLGEEEVAVWVKTLVERYIASDLYQALVKHPTEREVHFTETLFNIKGSPIYFQGSIDCLIYYEDGTLGIVDFKSGRPLVAENDVQSYKEQIALYALIAEKKYGRKVKTAELHFLQNCSKIVLDKELDIYQDIIFERCCEIYVKKAEQDYPVLLTSCSLCNYNYLCPKV